MILYVTIVAAFSRQCKDQDDILKTGKQSWSCTSFECGPNEGNTDDLWRPSSAFGLSTLEKFLLTDESRYFIEPCIHPVDMVRQLDRKDYLHSNPPDQTQSSLRFQHHDMTYRMPPFGISDNDMEESLIEDENDVWLTCHCKMGNNKHVPRCTNPKCYEGKASQDRIDWCPPDPTAQNLYKLCPYRHCRLCSDNPTATDIAARLNTRHHLPYGRLIEKWRCLTKLAKGLKPLPAMLGERNAEKVIDKMTQLPADQMPSDQLSQAIDAIYERLHENNYIAKLEPVILGMLKNRVMAAILHSTGEMLRFGFYMISSVVRVPADHANRVAFAKFLSSSTDIPKTDLTQIQSLFQAWHFENTECLTSQTFQDLSPLFDELLCYDTVKPFVNQLYGQWVNKEVTHVPSVSRIELAIRLGFAPSVVHATQLAHDQSNLETRPLDTDCPRRFNIAALPEQYYDFLKDATFRKCPCCAKDGSARSVKQAVCLLCNTVVCVGKEPSNPYSYHESFSSHKNNDKNTELCGTSCCTPTASEQACHTYSTLIDIMTTEQFRTNDRIRVETYDQFIAISHQGGNSNIYRIPVSPYGHDSRNLVGEATEHAIKCGGGSGAFLTTATGQLLIVDYPRSAQIHAPYQDADGSCGDQYDATVVETPRTIAPARAEQIAVQLENGSFPNEIPKHLKDYNGYHWATPYGYSW